jgi:hypothetical protein
MASTSCQNNGGLGFTIFTLVLASKAVLACVLFSKAFD